MTAAAGAYALVEPLDASPAGRRPLRRLVHSKLFIVGSLIVSWWTFWAVTGSHLTPHDPLEQTTRVLLPPGRGHWFGTDQLGRDVLSRVLAGARDTLEVAPLATLIALALGTMLGLLMGVFEGIVDESLGRLLDAFLALPLIVIAVTALVAVGHSRAALIGVIATVFAPSIARTVRAAVLGERRLEYVEAARLRGERAPYIMAAEILPNVLGPIVVEATVRLGYAIFAVAGLTFLGFGVQPPSPDWSIQVGDNYTLLGGGHYLWTVLFPAAAIASIVVAVNLIADAIQECIDA
jgi:peptide/nickel transport system permease protein